MIRGWRASLGAGLCGALASSGWFFALNLVLCFAALRLAPPDGQLWVGRVFFVWTSVFNMFVVSIFWSVMADAFRSGQAKRLFGKDPGLSEEMVEDFVTPWSAGKAEKRFLARFESLAL